MDAPRDWRRVPAAVHRRLVHQASHARRLVALAANSHAHVDFQGPAYLGPGFSLQITGRGSFVVGPNVSFRRDFVCEINGDGRVTIGAGSTFTYGAVIQCTTVVEIGEGVTLGQALLIADGNHRFRDPDVHMLAQGYDFRPIEIGAGAAVMSKCTVLASVGERAVVGANSVVTKPVPPFCLAVGAPARVVEYFGPPERRPPDLDA